MKGYGIGPSVEQVESLLSEHTSEDALKGGLRRLEESRGEGR